MKVCATAAAAAAVCLVAHVHVLAFVPVTLQRTKGRPTAMPQLKASRKDDFWRAVASSLAKEDFELSEISRVLAFMKTAQSSGDEIVPGLTASAWWEPDAFPWIAGLEAQWETIRDELQALQTRQRDSFAGDSALQSQVMGDGWSAVRLQRLGEWVPENTALFPATYELLGSLDIPFAIRGVMFARQQSGTSVARHTDGRNFILTCHLGLQVPKSGCWIECDGQRKEWQEGKAIVLDTSFEHETDNASSEDRFVLIIDFWHPDLTAAERRALQVIFELRNEYDRALYDASSR